MIKNIEAVLFDMDGTLIDSEKYYTEGTYDWLRKYGYQGNLQDVYPIVGTTMERTYEILSQLVPLKVEEIKEINYHYFMIENPIRYADIIFPEVKKALLFLKNQGIKMALCTSSGVEEVKSFFDQCALNDIFDVVLTKEMVHDAKPHPEIYLKALKFLSVDADKAIVVEDSPLGILAGKNAGLFVLARRDTRFKIDQSACDMYIDDLDDLLKLIKEKL